MPQDQIAEILKFDPKRKEKKKPSEQDEIAEILKFDPKKIGGTYQPAPSPVPGGTSPVSTITGKPIEEYVPGEEPSANMWTLIKAGMVDDPEIQKKIYAEARGIPVNRYRVFNGEIIFRDEKGNWQRETGELPADLVKRFLTQTASHPSVSLGTLGAIAGAPGAVAGAIGGAGIRKGIGALAFGEEQTTAGNLLNLSIEGLLAAAGEGLGKVIGRIFARLKPGAHGPMKYAGREIAEGLLTREDHAKAEAIRAIAKRYDIELAPHQLYDKEGMTNIWSYLRKHPATADNIRTFEDALSDQSDKAIQTFIKELGGYEETPFVLGKKLQEAATNSIKSAKEVRRVAASPHYQKAFTDAPDVDIKPVIEYIDTELATAKGEIRTQLNRAKKILEKPDLPKVIGEGEEAILNYDTSLQGLHGSKIEFDRIIENARQDSLGNTVKRQYQKIKDLLIEQMDGASPEYAAARRSFKELSEPVEKLKQSVIGELDRLTKEGTIAKAPHKLLDLASMPDAQLLRTARKSFDEKLWKRTVGSYIRDVYEGLKVTEEGKVVNAVGKLHKRFFGSQKQREIMRAALDPQQYKAFEDLMTIFQRAAIGTRQQSMTAPYQAIAREFGEIPGSAIYRWGMFPRQQATSFVFGKWNDILISGRQADLIEALLSPNALKQIKKLKPLTPGSRRLIDGFAVYTTMISTKLGIEDIGKKIPGEQRKGQR